MNFRLQESIRNRPFSGHSQKSYNGIKLPKVMYPPLGFFSLTQYLPEKIKEQQEKLKEEMIGK